MRITGGRFGGRTLAAPADARVRPTSDKARQAIFNILAHHDFGMGFSLEGARCLELFAGTGAMGLEALSRGAPYCLFIDNAASSRAVLRTNVEALALTGATKIWRRDATELGAMTTGAGGPFDVAFLDPPYRRNLTGPALASMRDGGWLAERALVVAEHALNESFGEVQGFSLLDARDYGATRIVFLAFAYA